MIADRFQADRFALPAFGIVLLVAWFCYAPALDGDFLLDDQSNLGGLALVSDYDSGVDFILSGDAGPTGRPLALASFALQADEWTEGPAAFLAVNILIHLLNAVLLCFCLFRLALARGTERDRALLIATIAASVWVLLPLLATATLLVVQRMTTLSATFVLLGLAGYLVARARLEEQPVRALAGMTASLVVGTALATLSKESGLLLPVFALVLEATVLARPQAVERRTFLAWKVAVLGVPLAALLVYLSTLFGYPESLELRRGFNAVERLLTEARVLWVYVHKAIVGLPGRLGIYQTPPEISTSLFELRTLIAVLGWLALLVAALVYRRRAPLFALGVLWFLAGHLVESTVVALEIYFEHRNYIAVIGPLFAIVAAVAASQQTVQRAGFAGLGLFTVANAFMLYTFASMWGDSSQSSRYWATRYPDSVRAVTTVMQYQLSEQPAVEALRTLDTFVINNPQHAYLRTQELNLRCLVMANGDHSGVVSQLERELPAVDFTYTAGTMLSQLLDTAARGGCNGISPGTVATIADALRSNPRYVRNASWNQFHFKLLAAIRRLEGDYEGSLAALRRAIAYRPSAELNMMMVTALGAAGDFDEAMDFIDDARNRPPRNAVRALKWQRDLDGLEAYIVEASAARER